MAAPWASYRPQGSILSFPIPFDSDHSGMITGAIRRRKRTAEAGQLSNQDYSPEEAAKELRKKHHYRQLILTGKLVLPYASAARLLGPDCLYQLYSRREAKTTRSGKRRPEAVRHPAGRDANRKGRRKTRRGDRP